MPYIHNPIAGGFYPDPSVCRVGSCYYRVHSSFAYAPGIPIFRSSDLVHWKQIGNVLTRDSQLNLLSSEVSGGVFAPTIRWKEGIFYVVVTNVDAGGNFYVTATDPAGPWSDPVWLKDAPGIDPSLFFEDGRCWYIGQRQKENARFFGDCEIWIQELDLKQQCLIGEPKALWAGAMKNANWSEGPHLYKKEDYYYLMIAESGTEWNHSISIARSHSLYGPYEGCPRNPIFTHRNLGRQYPVQCAGHGDLFDTPEGDWYILMLAVRMENAAGPLGRETFMADVTWEDGWPVINAGEGRLREWQWVNGRNEIQAGKTTGEEWNYSDEYVRYREIQWDNPLPHDLIGLRKFLLDTGTAPPGEGSIPAAGADAVRIWDGKLRIPLVYDSLEQLCVPAFIGIRMESRKFSLSVEITMEDWKNGGEAGLIWFYDRKNYLSLNVRMEDGISYSYVTERKRGVKTQLVKKRLDDNLGQKSHRMKITTGAGRSPLSGGGVPVSGGGEQQIGLSGVSEFWLDDQLLAEYGETGFLSSQLAGGFTGCILGIYGTGCGEDSCGMASFGTLNAAFGN